MFYVRWIKIFSMYVRRINFLKWISQTALDYHDRVDNRNDHSSCKSVCTNIYASDQKHQGEK